MQELQKVYFLSCSMINENGGETQFSLVNLWQNLCRQIVILRYWLEKSLYKNKFSVGFITCIFSLHSLFIQFID